ncbi:MAG: hypothetical protein HDT28_04825 [Clostridiales bacterium]|nr:hypothetical protein [Clostridiales bacterium]
MIIDEQILRAKCRHFSENMDFDKLVKPIIEEVEQLDMKPLLGQRLFIALQNVDKTGDPEREPLLRLLVGGQYEGCGGTAIFEGVYKAEAYYTYARLLRNPNGFLSATGFRQSVDTFSNYAEYKERESTIIAVKQAADSYMADCMDYIRSVPELAKLAGGGSHRRHGGITHVIGE